MKKSAVLSIVILLVSLFPTGLQPTAIGSDCTTILSSGGDIQAAVTNANPGDVICLEAGTYSPSATININQSVTIQGPQGGVDPRPSFGSTRTPGSADEAIIEGTTAGLSTILYIDANSVVVDGLEVMSGKGDMIYQGILHSGTQVRRSIIHDGRGDEGVQLKKCSGCILEYNYVYDIATPGDALNISDGSTNGIIRHNEVRNIGSENAAVYIYGSTNTTIECNLVYDVTQNDGIKLGNKSGGDATLTGGNILYNTVYNTAQDGIAVYMSETLVEGNEIHHSSSENGALYLAWGISKVTVTLNDVHDNTLDTGKWGDPGAIMIGTDVDLSIVSVNDNNIHGNSPNGLTNKVAALLDAKGNWWGAADGPSPAGSGDAVSTNVDFSGWLQEPVVIPNPCVPADDEGPLTYDVAADPNPVAVNGSVKVTATVDDTETGGSNIASAEYSLDGGAWTEMSAQDGEFDGVSEDVEATFSAPGEAGIYDLCVRGTDAAGNTGPAECIMLVVYDPDGGFVSGGGWIDSPPGAMAVPADVSLTGPLADAGWGGDYTRDASVVCNPNVSPVTVEGWVDVSSLTDNGALLIGLLDKKWIDDGNQGFFSGAYAYFGRRGMNLRIGPSDGNAGGGELNQVGANVAFDPWEGVAVPFSMVIHNGRITVSYAGNDYVDTYGDVPSGLTWNEFEFGAYPGVDLWSPGGSVNYEVQIQGCEVAPTGKANFGFVSKYKKGADVPTGNTEFVFQAADLNFHSTSYDWLVVTGSDYAKFKGMGTINGDLAPNGEEYRFMLWAGDEAGDGGADTFRIKIWWEEGDAEHVVYDNGMDQAIGGGNIVVHTKK